MTYTEIKIRNEKKYYYRVLSFRKNSKILKKRIYLGSKLSSEKLKEQEKKADKILLTNKMKKRDEEIQKIKSKIIKILKKHKVTKAGIFGSYARGEQKKNSDIDIVVNIDDKNMSLIGFIGLMQLLEKTLKKKIDLVEYSAIKPLIKENILNEEIKII